MVSDLTHVRTYTYTQSVNKQKKKKEKAIADFAHEESLTEEVAKRLHKKATIVRPDNDRMHSWPSQRFNDPFFFFLQYTVQSTFPPPHKFTHQQQMIRFLFSCLLYSGA
jgi:hypothetical protein